MRYLCQGVGHISEAQHEAKFKARNGIIGNANAKVQSWHLYLGLVYKSMYFRTSELNIATRVPIPAEPKNIMKNLWVGLQCRLYILQLGFKSEGILTSQCRHQLDKPWNCLALQSRRSQQW